MGMGRVQTKKKKKKEDPLAYSNIIYPRCLFFLIVLCKESLQMLPLQ